MVISLNVRYQKSRSMVGLSLIYMSDTSLITRQSYDITHANHQLSGWRIAHSNRSCCSM